MDDLAGNVWEWTDEREGASDRVFRGGSGTSIASNPRASSSSKNDPSFRGNRLVFWLAR